MRNRIDILNRVLQFIGLYNIDFHFVLNMQHDDTKSKCKTVVSFKISNCTYIIRPLKSIVIPLISERKEI